ncbi:MAG: sulfatase [Bacteroidales bacterium]|nr:sulfatase [Bacteroidales bacterium]
MIYLKNTRWLTGAVVSSLSVAASAQPRAEKQEQKPMNVLFLISDDMRAELNIYGSQLARTPNLDQLARQGVRFERGYCQYPLSGPSRTSLLTGRRPTTSAVYGNGNREFFGATYPDWISLPKYFRLNGYAALRTGKVFHGGIDDTDAWTEGGEERRWSVPVSKPDPASISEEEAYARYARDLPKLTPGPLTSKLNTDRWEAVEGAAVEQQGDTKVANRAIEYIRRSKETGQPFFIACGFSKPHSPLVAPKQFFDLYPPETVPLPVDFSSLPVVPVGFPAGSIRMNNADLFINRSASPEEARDMIRAYLACVSYVDWNIGRVIEELDRQGLRDNTIIVFWSDHGYQLGEKGKWSKAGSLWEQGAHVPFIILDPRSKGNGNSSPRTVELLDIYPTLVDLCGLPQYKDLEGVSLRPLLDNPYAEWDRPAYTIWNENSKGITGVVVRTERWRYAEFFGRGAGAFLTDPINDPNELRNLVTDPKYKDVVAKLHKLAADYVKGKTELPPTK